MAVTISGSFVDDSATMTGNVDGVPHFGIQGPPGPQGASGGYYVPAIEQTGENELEVSFSPSLPDMPNVAPVKVTVTPDPDSGGNVDFVVDNNPPEDTSVLWVDPDDNDDDGFQEAVNAALAQAKASGEFDGEDGVVAVTGARVGQTVKISAVDENGVPTAWEPVDFPEGGGGEKPWKKVAEIKTTEELNYISVNKDMEGNTLSFEDVIVMVSSTRAADATTNGNFGISLLPEWMTSLNSKSLYYNYTLHGDVYRTVVRYTLLSNGLIEIHNYSQMRIASKTSDYDFPSKMDMNPAVSGNGGVVRLEPAKSRYDMFDENGKFKGVTIGTDMITHTKMGVGTTLEVWIR